MNGMRVETVLGPVDPAELGAVDAHDHVLIAGGLGVAANRDLGISDVARAVEEVTSFRRSSGRTIVDAMPLDCGRYPEGLVEVARTTGVHIIATTGFHLPKYYDDLHWTYGYDVDRIADLLVAEVVEGMDRHSYNGPIVERISARPGLVKWSTDYGRMAGVTRKLAVAVATCHGRTGIPVLTHADHGTMLHEQLDLLEGLGVLPSRVLLSHVDRNLDLPMLRDAAARGAFLVFDGPSRIKYHPVDSVVGAIAKLFEAGMGDKVLVGLDHALRSQQAAYGGGPGSAFLFEQFVPRIGAALGADGALRVAVTNPAKALAFAEPA